MANSLNKINSGGIKDDSIVNADIKSDAAIALSKLASTPAVLTGSTDNTITTVTGANAIQGESGLTFDGTSLKVGASTSTRPISIYSASDAQIQFQGSGTGTGNNNADGFIVGNSGGVDATLWNYEDGYLRFATNNAESVRIDSSGRFLKGVTSSEASRSNTSARNPHVQFSSPWSSGLGSTSITCTDDYPILFLNSNATFQDNAGSGVITWSVKDGAGNYCNTAEIRSQIDGTPGNNDSPGELSFRTTADGSCQPTQRMKIHSTGNVEIDDGNLIIGTSGHGIDFSGTSGPTSGTDTSELFDDYEEGTWSPNFRTYSGSSWSDASFTTNPTTNIATYVKVGRTVQVSLWMYGFQTSTSGSAYAAIGNLPYSCANQQGAGIVGYTNNTFSNESQSRCLISTTEFEMYIGNNWATWADGSSASLYITGVYQTA